MAELAPLDTLKIPAFLKGIIRLYMYLRTIRKRRAENKRLIIIEEGLIEITSLYEVSKEQNDKEKMEIFNRCIHLYTIQYDMALLVQMIPIQFETWGKQLVGKQFIILMYESGKDLPKMIGKNLEPLISGLPNESSLIEERDLIRKQINTFKKEHNERLKELRHKCAAHMDDNSYEYLAATRSINISEIAAMATTFMIPVNNLTSLYRNIMKSMTDVRTKSY